MTNNSTTGTPEKTTDATTTPRKPQWWRKALKWIGITAGVIAALFVLICTLTVWILTPARLTPLVERLASDNLNATVSVSRVELTFWKTFPSMTLDVDSLSITSHSLDNLPDSVAATVPDDARALLSVKQFHGGVNMAALLLWQVRLYDVTIQSPQVNLVQINENTANYLIAPASETTEEEESSTLNLPKITLNRFEIADAIPIRYRSLPDSIDVAVKLRNVTLAGDDNPTYTLDVNGSLHTPLLSDFNFSDITLGALGNLSWESKRPYAVAIDNLKVMVDNYDATFSTQVDFESAPTVNTFSAATGKFSITDLLTHAPTEYRSLLEPLKTDMTVQAQVSLTRPWVLTDTVLPAIYAKAELSKSAIDYETLHINSIEAIAEAQFDGADLDASVFTIKTFNIEGDDMSASLTGSATNIATDPYVEGEFKGKLNLTALPKQLKEVIPAQVIGKVNGNADFHMHLSDLTPNTFHRLHACGELHLRNFDATIDSIGRAYTHTAILAFGSNNSFVRDAVRVDSLLTISLKADTLSAQADALNLQIRNLRAGAGTANRKNSADTTEINPFGMTLAMEKLSFDDPADTLRVRLSDASISGSLRRYQGNAKQPQINMSLKLGKLQFGQALNKVSLRDASAGLEVHLREQADNRPKLSEAERQARKQARADSIAARPKHEHIEIDLGEDNRKLLRNIDFRGHISAKSGRLSTPYFPLKNRLENIDLQFSQDSIHMHDLVYKAGQSDFMLDGTISNLRRALTSRRNNTLGVSLTVVSDTINVNEIVQALFAGTTTAQKADSTMVWSDDDRDETALTQIADTTTTGPLLIPHNINADMQVRAQNILYSDLQLTNFRGDLLIYDGAINLHDLSASTDIGSVRVDGLYSAPDVENMQFGMGLKVSDFRLDRLSSLVPAIDSLLPAMQSFSGIVNADMAVTTNLEQNMDINIPSLRAALKIEGDSLVLLDADTFKTISKWLLFRDKKHNMIDHMAVEVVVENSAIELYPFMFDIDRYRLGVMGHNDLAMNLNYHVSVLKSPIPFKFGINVKGTADKPKIRLGGAKFKENMVVEHQVIADNTRVNIVEQMNNVFRQGVSKARMGNLSFRDASNSTVETTPKTFDDSDETMSYADSLQFIRQGLIENPDSIRYPWTDAVAEPAATPTATTDKAKGKSKSTKKK